jgi:hypothetical protein
MTTPHTRIVRAPHDLEGDALPPVDRPLPSTETGIVRVAPGLLGKASPWRSLMFWVVGLLGFLAVILVALHFGSLDKMLQLVRSARPAWLIVVLFVHYVAETLQWDYERREPVSPLPVSGALISVDGIEYVITLAPDQHANASLWRVFESIKRLCRVKAIR